MPVFKVCIHCHRRLYIVYETNSPENKKLICPYCDTRNDRPDKTMVEDRNVHKEMSMRK